MSTDEIVVRALNPDDDGEVRQLCALYQAVGAPAGSVGTRASQERTSVPSEGDGAQSTCEYPFTQVADAEFWKNHAGQRFISATLRSGRTIIGHVGLRTDEFQPQVVEILFPVLSPLALHSDPGLLQSVRQAFDAFLSAQATRKGWAWVVAYLPAGVNGMMDFAWRGLGLSETAVLPLHRDGVHRDSDRATRINGQSSNGQPLSYKGEVVCFVRQAQAGSPTQNPLLPIQPPERHGELAQWLIKKHGGALPAQAAATAAGEATEPEAALYSRMSRRLAARITTVHPERLRSHQELTQALRKDRSRPHLGSIEAIRPESRSVCSLMEELGFRFAGFLPFYRGTSHCVFVLHESDHGSFITSEELKEESILARYLDRAGGGKQALGDACAAPSPRGRDARGGTAHA